MKIQPVRINPNFGYNKKLNKELITRLRTTEDDEAKKVAPVLLSLNSLCNKMENSINYLEGKNFKHMESNKNLIGMLLEFFIDSKLYLASMVEKFFPDLDYSKREVETYLEEDSKRVYPDTNDILEPSDFVLYSWHIDLYEELDEQLENIKKNRKKEFINKIKNGQLLFIIDGAVGDIN